MVISHKIDYVWWMLCPLLVVCTWDHSDIYIDLICPKGDHKIEINLWRTQITSMWSLSHILMKSGGKNLKINVSWPNLAYLLRLEHQNAQIAPPY